MQSPDLFGHYILTFPERAAVISVPFQSHTGGTSSAKLVVG